MESNSANYQIQPLGKSPFMFVTDPNGKTMVVLGNTIVLENVTKKQAYLHVFFKSYKLLINTFCAIQMLNKNENNNTNTATTSDDSK